jgi:hypothetical protein
MLKWLTFPPLEFSFVHEETPAGVNRRAFVDDAACSQRLASLISPSCTDRQRATPPVWRKGAAALKTPHGVPCSRDLRQNFVLESAIGQTKTPH